jgi:hypothetical protein
MTPSKAERRLRRLLCQGGLENALAVLRLEGATPIVSIAAVRAVERIGLEEAKRIVVESQTWADHRKAHEELVDAALKAVEIPEDKA